MKIEVGIYRGAQVAAQLSRWQTYLEARPLPLSKEPAWVCVLEKGLGHEPICLEASGGGATLGLLPLAFVRSFLFGRFLVSLPYLNYGGVLSDDEDVARQLLDRAIDLAEELQVRYLELRHEAAVAHPALALRLQGKVHMHLNLEASVGAQWDALPAKVRNQVRKGQKQGFEIVWGGLDLLDAFYDVFSHNMRDLGTPVFGRGLFRGILEQFPERTEIAVVRAERQAVASGLVMHGRGISEVPSASVLHDFRKSNANMLLYWHVLERAVQRGQAVFDFGRSSPRSNTYRFKKQWGAEEKPAEWQYYLRLGTMDDMRPDNPRFGLMIRLWKKLPVSVTRLLGPWIVRGIP